MAAPTSTTKAHLPGDAWLHVVPARVLARIVDLSLVLVAFVAATAAIGIFRYFARLIGWDRAIDLGNELVRSVATIPFPFTDAGIELTLVPTIAAVLFHLWNTIGRVGTEGATLAQSSMGIRVHDADGRVPGLGRAALRELLTLPVLPALAALADRRRRTAGDLAAGLVTASRDASAPPGVLRDVRSFRLVGQIVAVIAAGSILVWLFGNLLRNLDAVGIPIGLDFLDLPTNFTVPFDQGYDSRAPVRTMVWIGVKNTLLSAVGGIAIALVLGTIIGVARLSTNWLSAKLATLYVEAFRNIPPLVIIFFFSAAIFINGPFPAFTAASRPIEIEFPGTDDVALIVSKSLNGVPSLRADGAVGPFWIAVVVALVAAASLWAWRTRINIETGAPHRRVLWSTVAFLGIVASSFLILGRPYRMSWPAVSESGRLIENGFIINAPYISLTLALGLYTASHVAEIIRGAILAVRKGQTEAANALALSGFQRYRFVVLPQAARIAIPPLINQALNLTKNTSLGIAVAYPELTSLTQSSIGNGRSAVMSLLVLISLYLLFSFVISLVLNRVNESFQLVGR